MQKKAGALLYYSLVGIAGFIFATVCFIIYVSGLILDLLAFIGLLGVAAGSLVWGRLKKIWPHGNSPVTIHGFQGVLENTVRK